MLHVVASARQRVGGSSQGLPGMPSSAKGTTCRTITSLGLANNLRPWQRVRLDCAGPFQNAMFLVAVDAYSKWPEERTMNTTTAAKTMDVLREWFTTHGIPKQIVTDNGGQFTSEEFTTFNNGNGICHIHTAPYHPATNGLREQFVQTLKESLKVSHDDGHSLSQKISSYLLTYRTTAHATTEVPPCQLLMQRHLRIHFTLLQPDSESHVSAKQAQHKLAYDQ